MGLAAVLNCKQFRNPDVIKLFVLLLTAKIVCGFYLQQFGRILAQIKSVEGALSRNVRFEVKRTQKPDQTLQSFSAYRPTLRLRAIFQYKFQFQVFEM